MDMNWLENSFKKTLTTVGGRATNMMNENGAMAMEANKQFCASHLRKTNGHWIAHVSQEQTINFKAIADLCHSFSE